jgi:RHS repeat-associated protein
VRNNLSGIAFGNSRFVAVGEGVIIYSNCEEVTVAKSFNNPKNFPCDVSDRNSEIRYNEDMYDMAGYDQMDAYPVHGGHSASTNHFNSSSSTTLNNSTPGKSRTAQLYNTYYLYTFDGKLLAEYDHNGNCVRDYIYAGNRLIAEYKPQTNEYFYYMTDQINSTRIITNDSGNVVFSEAYGPYGDIQKTWTNTYDPKLKFSGKEREGYSDLDYFGARYYDHKSFRFNSVDPVINKIEALYNPQAWNLYAYCRNNPITYYDPDGREEESNKESKEESKSIWDDLNDIVGEVGLDNYTSPPMMMKGWEEDRQTYDKYVGNAIKIMSYAAAAVIILEFASGNKKKAKKKSGEHTKNARPSTKGKHQKGKSRVKKDHSGEKGDARRRPQRRRPKDWPGGKYPPKKKKK